jgi:1-acyl-sn-glycerol-3-phosphate acyltransferase
VQYDIDSLDNRDPKKIEKVLDIVDRFLTPYFRGEVSGVERVPEGAGLYVGNHNAGGWTPDSFIFGSALFHAHGMDSIPYALGHEKAIQLPFVRDLFIPLGAVRASHENAHRLFEAGKKVLVYPGGDYDSMRSFRDRNQIVFGGRKGYAKLAIREGVPIIPVVAAGAQSTWIVLDDGQWLAKAIRADKWLRVKVWPITLCLPWGITVGPLIPYIPFPSKILIEILDPIRFERSGEEAAADEAYVAACDEEVRRAMQDALTRLAAKRAA